MTDTSIEAITRFTVFVPGAYPQHSYVHRKFINKRSKKEFDPEALISNALKQPGMIAQVVGPSKSGKTRAIENCVGVARLLTVAGSQLEPGVSLWEIVARQLHTPIASEQMVSNGETKTAEAKLGMSSDALIVSMEAEATGTYEKTRESGQTQLFEADPFHAAVHQLKSQNKVLFLDDFHTIPEESHKIVAAQLKAAAQFGVKICLAEVPHHSDSTISALPDLTGRVQKIEFQYWSVADLVRIGQVGFEKLNTTVAPAALDAFAQESAGSPQLMQVICLEAAGLADVEDVSPTAKSVQFSLEDIRSVLLTTHSTIDRDRIFTILDQGPDERGNPRNRYPVRVLGSGDNYEIALAAISLSPPMTALTWSNNQDNLFRRIENVCSSPSNRPARTQITKALEQMQALAEKHMERQPILEWNAVTGLHILDPYFLFHVRWSEKYEKLRD